MNPLPPLAAVASLCLLAGCESAAEKQVDAAEDRIEQQADASAAAAGPALAALGLTETQLLDADLVSADGTDLGDVQQVRRSAGGDVEGLLIEIENSDPDRYVMIPLGGLATRKKGDDIDLQTSLTADDLNKMPAVNITGR